MNTRILMTCAFVLLYASAEGALAQATTYEFTAGVSQSYGHPGNWSPPGGPPESDDTAIIPDTFTCVVDDVEAARVVEVEAGGTLIVEEGNSLTLHGYVGVADYALIVDGDLFLEESSGGAASAIKFDGQTSRTDFVISGVGTISALADDDGKGLFQGLNSATEHVRVIFDSGLLVTGTIAFEDLDVRNNGDFYVAAGTSVDDVMSFDGATPAGAAVVSGAGTFEVDGAGAAMVMTDVLVGIDGRVYVTDGDLEFGYTAAPALPPTIGAPIVADLSFSPLLSVDGGTVSVYGDPPTFSGSLRLSNTDVTITNGGLIECDGDLTLIQRSTLTVTNGDVDLGGNLEVVKSTVSVPSSGTLTAVDLDQVDGAVTVSGGSVTLSGALDRQSDRRRREQRDGQRGNAYYGRCGGIGHHH